MPKYKGKDVKVGDVIEVPAARIITIGEGHIVATPFSLPSNIVVDDEANPPKAEAGIKFPAKYVPVKAPIVVIPPSVTAPTSTATTVAPK